MDSKIEIEKISGKERKWCLDSSHFGWIFKGLVISFLILTWKTTSEFFCYIQSFYNFILRITCLDFINNVLKAMGFETRQTLIPAKAPSSTNWEITANYLMSLSLSFLVYKICIISFNTPNNLTQSVTVKIQWANSYKAVNFA